MQIKSHHQKLIGRFNTIENILDVLGRYLKIKPKINKNKDANSVTNRILYATMNNMYF
jgi:hypothetical protein